MKVDYLVKSFNELTPLELYSVLQLRSEVFVVEQQSIYLDMDNKDQKSYHLLCFADGELAGYTRLIPNHVSYEEVSIGRVVIGKQFRGYGLGKQLMKHSIKECEKIFNFSKIRISAQAHLTGFYNTLGFIEEGEIYLEDGIEHIEMLKSEMLITIGEDFQ